MSGQLWDFFVDTMIALFMPIVCSYFAISGDLFFNVSNANATGLEKMSNTLLVPAQYLFAGKEAILNEANELKFRQRFEYERAFWPKSIASAIALPPSLILGGSMKALSFLSKDVRKRHASIISMRESTNCHSNIAFYRELGLDVRDPEYAEWISSRKYERRAGDEKHLAAAKEALKQIAIVFNEENIPWWVDCGTCLGTYRYGGVIPWDGDIDIGILLPDFENARRALNRLDPKKYQVQDWSGRSFPDTYFKIFVKKGSLTLDIDCFEMHPETQQLQCVFSLEKAIFFPEWVKIRERRFSAPASFSMVFPLKKAWFDGIEVFVPNQTKKYLQRCYGENLAPAKIYNPKTDRFEPDLSHPYWQRAYVH